MLMCSFVWAQSPAAPQQPGKQATPLVLSLPQGQTMTFIPVLISDNSNIFSYKTFNSGSGNYLNEPITRVKIAGTVYDGANWYIPFCETEVTRAQYAAVMGHPMPAQKEQNLPQVNVSVTDVQNFLAKLNFYMASNKEFSAAMHRYHNEKTCIFFCRLPSSVEWEFAARGGFAVDEGTFDRDYPYAMADLNRHEVLFTGSRRPASRSVKGRRKPNPLGLYDMLGNVSEMASPIYYFDSSMGRSGGLLACGGNFRTERNVVHASDRAECAPYREDGSEYRSETLGFRPIIGSVIRHKSMSMANFEAQWQEHVKELRTPVTSSPTSSTKASLDELVAQNEKEKKLLLQRVAELEKLTGTKTDLDKRAKTIATQLEQAQALICQSYRMQAEAGILMVSTSAANLSTYLYAEAQLKKLLNMPGSTAGPAVKKKISELQANIVGARHLLYRGCRLLADVSPEFVQQEAERQQASLLIENQRQYQCFNHAMEYFHQFKKTGKFPDPSQLAKKLLSTAEQQ